MKGKRLPDTTLSRSIIIEMRRKKAGERVGALPQHRRRRSCSNCGGSALRWANDNGEKLEDAEPDMPPGFDNRLGDNWSSDVGHRRLSPAARWPDEGAQGGDEVVEGCRRPSIGARLLADIRAVFYGTRKATEPLERISSADLAATLGADVESLWAEWKGGKPITQAQLARVLKPFGIASEEIRLPSGGTLRGYMRSQFEDAWERYL